jgi:hypothetical protein
MVSNRHMIVTALAAERRLTLSSICAHHRVMWVANEIERNQVREYTEAVHFSQAKQSRPPPNPYGRNLLEAWRG